MDVETWLIDQAAAIPDGTAENDVARNLILDLASEWRHVNLDVPVLGVGDEDPRTSFDPKVYPACVKCGQAWKLTRLRGVWAWSPDCQHTVSIKLVQA